MLFCGYVQPTEGRKEESRMTDILKTIRDAWGWRGLEPAELIAISAFGNVIVQDAAGEDRKSVV